MRASLRTLRGQVKQGLFSVSPDIRYRFEYHLDAAKDWTEFLERPGAGGLEADTELLDAAIAALTHGEGRIVVVENDLAAAYRPTGRFR